mmetsp:Transcript_19567/g.61990  ORF Transcript_19567/g.61990 Transcript_19567/m.61990 type:complete len:285 (-) Transcript_19567:987-1841(-)
MMDDARPRLALGQTLPAGSRTASGMRALSVELTVDALTSSAEEDGVERQGHDDHTNPKHDHGRRAQQVGAGVELAVDGTREDVTHCGRPRGPNDRHDLAQIVDRERDGPGAGDKARRVNPVARRVVGQCVAEAGQVRRRNSGGRRSAGCRSRRPLAAVISRDHCLHSCSGRVAGVPPHRRQRWRGRADADLMQAELALLSRRWHELRVRGQPDRTDLTRCGLVRLPGVVGYHALGLEYGPRHLPVELEGARGAPHDQELGGAEEREGTSSAGMRLQGVREDDHE